jgi:glycosyltransferase involved in cell wall biosynthesis
MVQLRSIPKRDNDEAPETPTGALWPVRFGQQNAVTTQYPKISIITPVKRGSTKWLNECWESLAAQDEIEWEWLVELDGNGPIEPDILKLLETADSRLKLAGCGIQMYGAATRNMALSRAQGQWVLPLDADDMLAPNALSTLLAAAEDSSAKVIVGTIDVLFPDGSTKHDTHSFPAGYRPADEILDLVVTLQRMPHHAVGTLMDTRLLTQFGGYPAVPYAQDLLVQYLLASRVGIVAIPQTTYIYRHHDAQMTADTTSETWRLAQWRSRIALSRMLAAPDQTVELPDHPIF